MAQELLDGAQVPPALQEVGREGVSEGVGAGLGPNGRPDQAPGHDPSYSAIRQGLPLGPDEERVSPGDASPG